MNSLREMLNAQENLRVDAAVDRVRVRCTDCTGNGFKRALQHATVTAQISSRIKTEGGVSSIDWFETEIAETLFSSGYDVEGVDPCYEDGTRKIR